MREELDKKLCEKYPHMFKNRYASMQETAMCWGFSCGDGWYKIINALCFQIESHVKWKREQRARDLLRNRAVKRGYDAVLNFITRGKEPDTWHIECANRIINEGLTEPTELVSRVVVDQVKEKFGGLRFYYHGGDDVVDGMVRMAESWAAYTCEECGDPGHRRDGGWVRTLCDKHEDEYQKRMSERFKDV